jgi:uncharacterized membrane protein
MRQRAPGRRPILGLARKLVTGTRLLDAGHMSTEDASRIGSGTVTGPRAVWQNGQEGHLAGVISPARAEPDNPEVDASATARVIFFSDAVVAIAITLLALALPLPHSIGTTTNSQLLHDLVGYWDQYLAFFISFVAIGNHWAAHRRVFRYAARTNYWVGLLTWLWLLMIILTPFAARLLAGSGGFGVRFTLYVLIQVMASIWLVLMSREVIRAGLLRPDAPAAARHPDRVASFTIIVMFSLSAPIAFLTPWAFAFWAAVPLVVRAIRWRQARGPVCHLRRRSLDE